MIRGHLDSLTPSGVAEGWAFDDADPSVSVTIRILSGEQELGRGFANLYRGDLADVGFRNGWCAFRLRLSKPAEALCGARLSLQVADGKEIHATESWRIRETPAEPKADTVEAIIAQDPTVLRNVLQLSGCGDLLARYAARHGVTEFVRAAYGYVLGRPADQQGLASYERMLGIGAVTPLGMLMLLAESAEFREQARLLASPADPGFAFVD